MSLALTGTGNSLRTITSLRSWDHVQRSVIPPFLLDNSNLITDTDDDSTTTADLRTDDDAGGCGINCAPDGPITKLRPLSLSKVVTRGFVLVSSSSSLSLNSAANLFHLS